MSARLRRNVSISQCMCLECGCKMPVPRKVGQFREKGHLKKLWCPCCKKEVNMKEIREFDVYKNGLGELIYNI